MAQNSYPSVTKLVGLGLTPGKLRGLQRISNPNGTLTMTAMDQNSSMINMMKDALKKKGENREPTYDEIVEAKVTLGRILAPVSSAVLIDAYYGVAQFVNAFCLPRDTGLLVRVEKSGADKNKRGAPLGEIEPGWSVGKIKRMGCDAVKLLAQFEPSEPESCEHQFQFINKIYEDCIKHDILLLLECVGFQLDGEKKDAKSYLDRKAETVIESARQLSRYCDVYKAEFPGTYKRESDAQLQKNLEALNAATVKPWVLLSAGVDFPDYKVQVEMAMKAGASGVLGGRAFWKEYFLQEGQAAREKFAKEDSVPRVKQIDAIVREQAKPWYAWYGMKLDELQSLRASEGWHARYGSSGPAGSSAKAAIAEGDVY